MPYVKEKKENIENIDDWIKSLRIYKLKYKSLGLTYYQTSNDLYQDMKKKFYLRKVMYQ